MQHFVLLLVAQIFILGSHSFCLGGIFWKFFNENLLMTNSSRFCFSEFFFLFSPHFLKINSKIKVIFPTYAWIYTAFLPCYY